jgi:hypothetical protein
MKDKSWFLVTKTKNQKLATQFFKIHETDYFRNHSSQ